MKYMEERFAVIGKNRNQDNFKDLYEVLQVDPSVDAAEIKA